MSWNLHMLSLFTCENIKSTVAFIIHVFGADHSTHPSIVLHLCQLLSLRGWIVVETDQVISCPTLVLLASIKVVSLSRNHLLLLYIITLHIFKSLDLSLKSLLSQMSILVHIVLKLLLSDLGVGHWEVLVESLLLGDEVRRVWVWVVHLGAVYEFMVTACPLTESCLLDSLFIFHSSPLGSCPWNNVVENWLNHLAWSILLYLQVIAQSL